MYPETKSLSVSNMVLIALMAAVICVLGPLSIPIPVSPVPISFTNLAIFLTVCLLGWKAGTISYLVYLAMGLAGLPVFSGFSSGFGILLGPTGGYLLGMIFTAIISGLSFESFSSRFLIGLGLIVGIGVSYVTGTLWLCVQAHLTFAQGLMYGVIPYIPGDLMKILAALVLGPVIKRRLLAAGLLSPS